MSASCSHLWRTVDSNDFDIRLLNGSSRCQRRSANRAPQIVDPAVAHHRIANHERGKFQQLTVAWNRPLDHVLKHPNDRLGKLERFDNARCLSVDLVSFFNQPRTLALLSSTDTDWSTKSAKRCKTFGPHGVARKDFKIFSA